MKLINIIFRVLFIIAVPVLLISLSIAVAVNSKWLYDAGFKKYNISQVTGITLPELDKAAAGIVNYFNNNDEYLNVTIVKDGEPYKLYSEDEKQIIHMKDVKALFRLDYAVLAGSFVFTVLYIGVMLSLKKYRGLGWGLLGGGVFTVALMLILGVGILLGFDTLFTDFHLISFSNDFWMLDPNVDVLIMMFPDGFWFDIVAFIAVLTAVLAVIVGGVGGLIVKKTKSQDTITKI